MLLNAARMISCFGVENKCISIANGSHCLVTMGYCIVVMFLVINTGEHISDHKHTYICSESREPEKLNTKVLSIAHKTWCY